MLSNELRLALSLSIGLHIAVFIGIPFTAPVVCDVTRASQSLEISLQTETPRPPAAPVTVVVEQPEPDAVLPPEEPLVVRSPMPVVAPAMQGAIVELEPGYVKNAPPRYPTQARERGEEGTVVLEVEVLASGRCGLINILTSSGVAVLDEAAREAVRGWRFRPARRWQQPVTVWVEIPITFRLLRFAS